MQCVDAWAKVNLALNILGVKKGMHLLDGVYVTCALCDKVTLSARQDDIIDLRYLGRDGIYENDRALIMAKKLSEAYHTPGMDIVIEKNIPERCGLGGSSADAAGVAKAFEREFSVGEIDQELLLSVGSDVPFQYKGGCARVSGRGEQMIPLKLPKLYLALLRPDTGLSTAECFALYDKVGGEKGDIDLFLKNLTERKAVRFFNGLEKAASTLAPDIAFGRKILEDAGFSCGMTGSGSVLFGVEYEEDISREKLKKIDLKRGNFTLLATEMKEI